MEELQRKVCKDCAKYLQPEARFVDLATLCATCRDAVIEWFEDEEEQNA